MEKYEVFKNIVKDIELDRIRKLPVPEKFKLYEYVKLIYTEAEYASKEGFLELENSPNYTINKTYNLFAMLMVNLADAKIVKDIILNYARNFDTSDIYYAQITITGIGLLMIEEQFSSEGIYHFLLHLLGDEFLMENLKTTAAVKDIPNQVLKFDADIKYKPFEGDMRHVKYDLLALLKLRHDKGNTYVEQIIETKYSNSQLQFYYNMLNSSPEIASYLYDSFMEKDNRRSRLIAAGASAILNEKSIISTHYLFNSIIGKYSRFDKRKEEIDAEINERLNKMI